MLESETNPALDLFGSHEIEINMVAGLPAEEVVRRLATASRVGDACQRVQAFYLIDLEQRGLHQVLGFASVLQLARQRLGMSRSRASELLSTGRRLLALPLLDAAFARGELSWSKVRRLARVASADTEAAWIARASQVSIERVEQLVASSRPGDAPPEDGGLPVTKLCVHLMMDPLQQEMWERAREKLQAEFDETIPDERLADEMVRLILASNADGSVPGRRPTEVSVFAVPIPDEGEGVSEARREAAASDAAVTPPQRRRVLAREGHRCAACESQRSLMIHHVVWLSRGGKTTLDNLFPACSRCHGLLHDELLFVSGRPGNWVLRDRQGRELTGVPAACGVRLRVASTIADSRPASAEVMTLDEVPDVIDRVWWREHGHHFEFGPDGRTLRRRREPSRSRCG